MLRLFGACSADMRLGGASGGTQDEPGDQGGSHGYHRRGTQSECEQRCLGVRVKAVNIPRCTFRDYHSPSSPSVSGLASALREPGWRSLMSTLMGGNSGVLSSIISSWWEEKEGRSDRKHQRRVTRKREGKVMGRGRGRGRGEGKRSSVQKGDTSASIASYLYLPLEGFFVVMETQNFYSCEKKTARRGVSMRLLTSSEMMGWRSSETKLSWECGRGGRCV